MSWQPDYATVAELRAYITRSAVTADDTELQYAVTAASRVVDEYCGRQFGSITPAAARIYTAEFDKHRCRWIIETDDIYDATGLTVFSDDNDDQVFDKAVDSFRKWPYNPTPGYPWTRLVVNPLSTNFPVAREGAVQVTALFGWAAVPTAVKQATLIEANRIFQRRVSPFGIAGSPETGSELRLLRAVDVDAQKALAPYRKLWGAA